MRDGAYNENVNVAHLTIRSENGSASCIVNAASSSNHVFEVTENYVNISEFTVTNATGSSKAGIYPYNTDHCNISSNNALGNYCGIRLYSSSNYNTLTENTANSNDDCGIRLWSSSDNNVSCNWVQNNTNAGFYIDISTDNTIEHNNIIANGALHGDGSYRYQFYNRQGNAVEAKHNYWGAGMNNSTIKASIMENTGIAVTFYPFRTGPAPCAPIPELPTVMLFAVGMLMLAGYVRVGRRK